eukprot:jgi/Botrbrau1/17363/Bobra.0015s0104.1
MPNFQPCCAHDHDCEAADCGPAWSLYQHINTQLLTCLNEAEVGAVKRVFRPWGERTNMSISPLESNDDDPELLIHVPFDGHVKIKAICVIGGSDRSAPSELRAYVNRDGLDFSTVNELAPVQKWDLQESGGAQLEYPTQVAKFSGVHCVDLHFPCNFGADSTKIHFIGFKGEHTQVRREAVVTTYEAKPNVADHKLPGITMGTPEIL